MSGNPSPNTTPPPGVGVGGSSAQKIGNAFIKQYYKILLTAPSQLNRFYQPDSTVSRGMEPSAPAPPSPFSLATTTSTNGESSSEEESPGERVRKAFFEWAGGGDGADGDGFVRVDFERGAIDAQESIGGGILLVVTGHMFLPGKDTSSQFVHTFFLNNNSAPGMKKQFLVKNDILRFLEPVAPDSTEDEIEEEVTFVVEETVVAPGVGEEPVVEEVESSAVDEPLLVSPPAIEPIPLVPVEYEPSADEEKVDDDDGEVEEPVTVVQHEIVDVEPATEEEKMEVTETSSADSDSPAASPSSDGKKSKRNRKKKGGKSRSRSNSPRKEEDAKEDTPEKPKAPSTWATLVASSGGGEVKASEGGKKGRKGSPKGSRGGGGNKSPNKQDSAKAPPQSQKSTKESTSKTNTIFSDRDHNRELRRPEATLFIRNIPDKTTENEMRLLFEPHGLATGNKILSVTLNPHRGFCFVDFDGPAAVIKIVEDASTSLVKDPRTGRKVESKFMIHNRVLEVERKVPKQHNNGGGGSGGRRYNRSHSPKDGGGRYRGSRGGRGGGNR